MRGSRAAESVPRVAAGGSPEPATVASEVGVRRQASVHGSSGRSRPSLSTLPRQLVRMQGTVSISRRGCTCAADWRSAYRYGGAWG
jgi:hypothetical protein